MRTRPPSPRHASNDRLHDPLTGLLSRAAVLDALGRALSLADRLRHTVSVLFIAIDGHDERRRHDPAEADALEQTLALRLASRVRTHDVLGQWTRGQFLVVLPETDAAHALVLAEDLRGLAPLSPWPNASLSIGVHGRLPTEGRDWLGLAMDMVAGAQRALEATAAEGPSRLAIEPASLP